MGMFCYQCQETAGGKGCTKVGVCGKGGDLANLQDLMIYALKGISVLGLKADEIGYEEPKLDRFIIEGLFMTITNANFDKERFFQKIREALKIRDKLKETLIEKGVDSGELKDTAIFTVNLNGEIIFKGDSKEVGVLSTKDEDIRKLRRIDFIC